MHHLDDAKALLRHLIAFPTISTDSNLAMIEFLADRLTAVGARVDIHHDATGAKANLFATLGPDIDGGILLVGPFRRGAGRRSGLVHRPVRNG